MNELNQCGDRSPVFIASGLKRDSVNLLSAFLTVGRSDLYRERGQMTSKTPIGLVCRSEDRLVGSIATDHVSFVLRRRRKSCSILPLSTTNQLLRYVAHEFDRAAVFKLKSTEERDLDKRRQVRL